MSTYLLVPLVACVASSMLLAVFLAGRIEHRANRPAALLTAGAIWWSFCEVLWNAAPDAERALSLVKLSAFGWVAMGPLGLQVLASVTNTDGARLRRVLPLLYLVSAGFFLIDLTTPWIHPSVMAQDWGWSYRLGPAYPAFYLFTVGCIGVGLVLALRARPRLSPAERRQTRVLILGLAVPLAIASLTDGILPYLGADPPRLGTVSFAFLGGSIAWSFQHYGYSLLAPRGFASEILETLGDGVALLHLDGRVRRANRSLETLLGAEPGELEGQHVHEHVPDVPLDPPDALRDLETEISGPRGSAAVSLSSALLHDKRGFEIGLVLVVRDLSEVFELRRQLVTSGSLRAVGGLAAGIAHEVNNPLAYVRTNLGVLRDDVLSLRGDPEPPSKDSLDEAAELLEESIEGLDRIAAIVRDLRGFAGETPDGRERVDLNDLLRTLLRVLHPHLRYRADVALTEGSIQSVAGSPQQLRQLFMNLLLRAGDCADGSGQIAVETRMDGPSVVVSLTDDGRELAPEALERVFDPYLEGGEGPGFAIAYQVVRQHGGEIRIDSEAGLGTTVEVRLPGAG